MLHKNQVQTLPKQARGATTAKKRRAACPAPKRATKSSKSNWLGHLVAIAIVGVCAYAIVTGGKP